MPRDIDTTGDFDMPTATQRQIGKLAAIAGDLRTAAEQRPAAHARLPHGLEIVMQRTASRWRLALGRENVHPSDTEVAICRRTTVNLSRCLPNCPAPPCGWNTRRATNSPSCDGKA